MEYIHNWRTAFGVHLCRQSNDCGVGDDDDDDDDRSRLFPTSHPID